MSFEKLLKRELPTPAEFYAELTNPMEHNPNQYCYIIHAINPLGKIGLLLVAINTSGYDFNQEFDLLMEPRKIVDKKIISTSIIDQDHNATWGDAFFILDVPWNNFVSMFPRDNATNVTNPDFVKKNAKPPEMLPSELIRQTAMLGGKSNYNEVVITGRKSEEVKIVGIGIKKQDIGAESLREPEEAHRMRQIAQELNVPVIEFVEKVRIHDSKVEISEGFSGIVRAFYINRNGFRYCFEGYWDKNEIQDVFRGHKNVYGGHNSVNKEEYMGLRSSIREGLSKKSELEFLKKLDEHFGINYPDSAYQI